MATKPKPKLAKSEPEPVKEPAPKKAVKKKVVNPAAQRVAEPVVETAPEVHTIEIVPQLTGAAIIAAYDALKKEKETLPAPEQHGEAVAPVVTIEPVIEEHHEPTKLTISQRWHNFKNSSWFWLTIAVFALIILWAVIAEIRRGKINKTLWNTQQTETKITDEKGELSKTEANLSEMLDIKQKVDSLNIIIDSMQKLASDHAAYEETMHQLNLKYKLRNYELQNQIRTASDDSLRKIVSDLSKQK